ACVDEALVVLAQRFLPPGAKGRGGLRLLHLRQLTPARMGHVPEGERFLERLPGALGAHPEGLADLARGAVQARLALAKDHRHARLLDERPGGLAQASREADALEGADQPFARVPVVPAHAVAEIRRELVVEVVVALAVRD